MDLPPHFIGVSNQLAAAVADRMLDRHAAPTLEFDVALRSTRRIRQRLALNPQLLATKSNTQQGERRYFRRIGWQITPEGRAFLDWLERGAASANVPLAEPPPNARLPRQGGGLAIYPVSRQLVRHLLNELPKIPQRGFTLAGLGARPVG